MEFNVPLKPSHQPEIMEIYAKLVANYDYPVGGNWRAEGFKEDIIAQQILGAFDSEGALAAFLSFSCQEQSCDILKLAVASKYQRQGVMSQFIQSFINLKAVKTYFVEVHEKNLGAIGFYKKQGFSQRGYRKNFYGQGASAYLLAIDL